MTPSKPHFHRPEAHSVYIFFPDGTSHCEGRNLDALPAIQRARSFINRPAAKLGVITRIIVTDRGGATNFEWKYGEGITFPLTDTTRKWNESYLTRFKAETPK